MRPMLSGKATCNSHGQDSSYFLGWEKYEKNPYDQIQNPQGIIQMGLAENQLSFDLLESGLSKNQDIAGFKRNGDQIPNLTTASASRDGASPTSPQVVDDSISVVVDGSPPIDDGAIRRLNAHGTRTTTTAGSSQVRTFNSSQPSAVHPIVVVFQRQELGKAVLGFAVPMATGLLFTQYRGLTHLQASAIALVLSIGIAITWNGILLHGICRRVATVLECFGAVTILTSFFGLVSSFLSPSLVWACWLCCGFSWLPFIWCLVLPAEIEKESSAKRLDQDVV